MDINYKKPNQVEDDSEAHISANAEIHSSENAGTSASFPRNIDDYSFMTDVEGGHFRCVDSVLAWDTATDSEGKREKRTIFLRNLESDGIEVQHIEPDVNQNLRFVKLHAPMHVLKKYAEILKIRMPIKNEVDQVGPSTVEAPVISAAARVEKKSLVARLKEPFYPSNADRNKDHEYTESYSRDKDYLFDQTNTEFFTPSLRSRIMDFLLQRKSFTKDPGDHFTLGIARLINDEVFVAAYPLHDGGTNSEGSMRKLLFDEWASFGNFWKFQPLDSIKDYFGVKFGFYYAWLGYYNFMLILPSIVGLLCFFYGVYCFFTDIPTQEICEGSMANATMCPICDTLCDFWDLSEACQVTQLRNLFDNEATIFFAIFMSIWAVIFTEFWKRYSADITHRWDVFESDPAEEHPRPEYLAELRDVKEQTFNYISQTPEPKPLFWKMKMPGILLSSGSVVMFLALTLITVIAIIVYRMSMVVVLARSSDDNIKSHWTLFISVTSAAINLVIIIILDNVYDIIAMWLTEKELHRTQTDFDDSLTVKIYLFFFVNHYASIFYIAFFKGKFIGTPESYNRLFDWRQEECLPGGCFMELSVQLSFIFMGKQFFQAIVEHFMPIIMKIKNVIKFSGLKGDITRSEVTTQQDIVDFVTNSEEKTPQYIKDFKLLEWGRQGLLSEYLEMVIQYGFITIFVCVFPLAPLFALLNNAIELRLDARKLLVQYRRPPARKVQSIGVWFDILETLGTISVVTNSLIIALTSEFIPRTLYRLMVSEDGSLTGYVDFTLSDFDTSHLDLGPHPHGRSEVPKFCKYTDYKHSHDSADRYANSKYFWHIWFAKILFVVIYQNVIAVLVIVLKLAIPDIPAKLKKKIKRENYITKEMIIKMERKRERF